MAHGQVKLRLVLIFKWNFFFLFAENEGTRNSKIPSWGKPKIIKTSSMSRWSVWNYVRMLEIWVSVGVFLPEFLSFSLIKHPKHIILDNDKK